MNPMKNVEHDIIKYSDGNVCWKNTEGVYMGCNENMAKVFGLASPKDVIGKTDHELYPAGEDINKIIENDQEVIRTQQKIVFEESGRDQQGHQAWYLTKKRVLKDANDSIIGVLCTSIDITEFKAAQQQATEEQAKRKHEENLRHSIAILAGKIGHDLRTPLCTISLVVLSLTDSVSTLVSACQQDHAEELQNHSKYTQQLASLTPQLGTISQEIKSINNYITLTLKMLGKIVSGAALAPEELVTCCITRIIDEALSRYPFKENEEALVHVNNTMTFNFLGNDTLMIHNLFNLIKNSLEQIKKQGHGKIYITVEVSASKHKLIVKDTAGGASSDIVSRIFEGYQTNKKDGTGIGLSSCKMTMQSFGGDITCHSVEGEYIEFTMTFPVLKDTAHISMLKKSRSI